MITEKGHSVPASFDHRLLEREVATCVHFCVVVPPLQSRIMKEGVRPRRRNHHVGQIPISARMMVCIMGGNFWKPRLRRLFLKRTKPSHA